MSNVQPKENKVRLECLNFDQIAHTVPADASISNDQPTKTRRNQGFLHGDASTKCICPRVGVVQALNHQLEKLQSYYYTYEPL